MSDRTGELPLTGEILLVLEPSLEAKSCGQLLARLLCWLASAECLISAPVNCTALNVRSRCEDIFMRLVNIFIRPVNMQKICAAWPQTGHQLHARV